MKKKSSLSLLVILIVVSGHAQSFMHSVGVNISVMNAKINTPFDKYSVTTAFSNFIYFPRFTVLETEGSSVSIGAPVGAGVSLSRSTYGDESGIFWGVELPAVIDYNIGWKSTPENDKKFGAYFGGGFGYTFTNWSDGNSVDKINSYGPIARAGIRIGGFGDLPLGLTIGLSYKSGLEAEKFKTYSMQVLLDL